MSSTIRDVPIRVVTDILSDLMSLEDGFRVCFALGPAFLSDFIETKRADIREHIRPIRMGDVLVMASRRYQSDDDPLLHEVALIKIEKVSAKTATVRQIAFSRGCDRVTRLWLKEEPETKLLDIPIPWDSRIPYPSFEHGLSKQVRFTGLQEMTLNKRFACKRDRNMNATFRRIIPDTDGRMFIAIGAYSPSMKGMPALA